jgi:DNA-binding response OmpR family regulator
MNPIGPVITKPFTTEYLSRRVRMVLDRQPEASPTR